MKEHPETASVGELLALQHDMWKLSEEANERLATVAILFQRGVMPPFRF
ncbi:MAG: hypothetical protein ACHQUC_05960 [Chlamydiales bacterium]